MMKKILAAFFFCLLFTGGISFSQEDGYRIYKSSVSNEQGELFVTVPASNCTGAVNCDGVDTLMILPADQFQVCWSIPTSECESGPLTVAVPGVYFFTVRGYVGDREQSYEKYNPNTQQMETVTYTLPGHETPPSNEVTLIVNAGVDEPDPPSGCSIRRYIQ